MKIIHLSDTHLGRQDNLARFSALIDDLIAHPPDTPASCCVLHTGDLIDSGQEQQRAMGRTQLDRLRDAGFKVFLCPGNHDYGNALGVSNAAAQAYRAFFADYMFAGQRAEFPVLHFLDEKTALILLDSNEAELSFYSRLFAEGHLGDVQRTKLNAMLDDPRLLGCKRLLALHHHPFSDADVAQPDHGDAHLLHHLVVSLTRSFRRLKDAYSLCEIIRGRVDYLFFGHRHFGLDCSAQSRFYDIACAVDGGSSTATDNRTDRIRYRVVDLPTGKLEVRVRPL